MFNQQKDRIFYSFLASYLIILFLIVGLGAVSYTVTLRIVERDTQEANMAILNKSRQIIEGRFSEIEKILKQLAMHPQVTRITYSENPLSGASNLIQIQDVRNLLVQYQLQDSFLVALHLFLNKSGITISTDDIFLRKEFFYNHFFQFEDLTADEWSDFLFSEIHNVQYLPLSNVLSSGQNEQMLGIVQSLIVKGYGLTKSGVISAFISGEEISALLGSCLLKGDGVSLLLDSSNQLLAVSGDLTLSYKEIISAINSGDTERRINGEEMILSSMVSQERGWTYITAVPRRIAMKKIVSLRRILLLIVSGSIILGILLSILFARRTSAPLREIKGILDGRRDLLKEGISQNHFPEAVRELVKRNHYFKERISRQKSLLHASFCESLIMGKYENDKAAEASFSFLDEAFIEFPIALLCIKIQGNKHTTNSTSSADLLSFRLLLRTVSEDIIGEGGICHDTGLDSMIILWFNHKAPYRQSLEELAVKINSVIHLEDEYELLFSSGRLAETFCEVTKSYNEGIAAQHYLFHISSNMVRWFQDIPEKGDPVYSLDFEKRIINSILAGDVSAIDELIIQLKRSNFIDQSLSLDAHKQFQNDLRSTLLKIKYKMKTSDKESEVFDREMKLLFSLYSVDPFFKSLKNFLHTLANLQNTKKRSHNDLLKEKILDYINENYCDSGLYLSATADYFQLSEVYLSQFFKEQTGENFSSFLEKKRINKARKLMEEKDFTLSEISEICGYNSPQVFRRAFKRLEGVSPSQFRDRL